MNFLFDLVSATFRNAAPLVYGTTGETITRAIMRSIAIGQAISAIGRIAY